MSRPFKPFSKPKQYRKAALPDDRHAPAHMHRLTTGAWHTVQTLTDRQKKRLNLN